MAAFDFVLLYVRRPADSETFYADLLGRPAIESSPTFAMFSLGGGAMLGLWAATACSRHRHSATARDTASRR